MKGALALTAAGNVPGGTTRNLAELGDDVEFAEEVGQAVRTLLADAQTSGGLLMSVPPETAPALVAALERRAPAAAVIGEVVAGRPGHIRVD